MSNLNIAKGRCLCGAVSLSTTSMSKNVGACHCSICRNWGGGQGVDFVGKLLKKLHTIIVSSIEVENTVFLFESMD